MDGRRPILSSDIKQHQTRLCVPKVICQPFATSVTADHHCAREALVNKPCHVDRNNLIYRINIDVGIGRRKKLTHRASGEKEAAVIDGEAHTEVALDFRYLSFACGHLINLAGLPMI